MKIKIANPANQGFTLIEVLAGIIILGILTAIAAPNLIGFLNRQRLISSNNQVYRAMLFAQSNAKRDKVTWQASFRDNGDRVEWVAHPATTEPDTIPSWNQLESDVVIDASTTLLTVSMTNPPIRSVRFDLNGNTVGRLGRLTISLRSRPNDRRCVFVSTLIGTLRNAENNNCLI
ncbi:MAG: prepilin-type N-terminal cleavage/methylation domain-containing protein [Chloroflexaceae bacterium]|nr:prepilin-type N-terminal cleavage/methylation domain-containing protein [Chloroflexaceae bacterium]